MDAALEDLQEQIDRATERLLGTIGGLTDDDIRQASLLPGWTRGHVLTHIARTGDALCNLLRWARTGVPTPAYPSQQARDAAIETGAGRGVAELLADVTKSAGDFRSEATDMPEQAWQRMVRVLDYNEFPASQVLVRRLVEVELHHVDLDAGYGPGDWPTRFAELDLGEPMRRQREDRRSWKPGTPAW
jgi:maleylpyruvate isomerase